MCSMVKSTNLKTALIFSNNREFKLIKSLFKYKRIRNVAKGIGALYLLIAIIGALTASLLVIEIAIYSTIVLFACVAMVYTAANLFEFMSGDRDEK